MRKEIDNGMRRRIVKIECGRRDIVENGKSGEERLGRKWRKKKVEDGWFGGRNRNIRRRIKKKEIKREKIDSIGNGGSEMRIDIVDIVRKDKGKIERRKNEEMWEIKDIGRGSDMEGIERNEIEDELGINIRKERKRVLKILKKKNERELENEEEVKIIVIRKWRGGRIVIEIGGKRIEGGKERKRNEDKRRLSEKGKNKIRIEERNEEGGIENRVSEGWKGSEERVVRKEKIVIDRKMEGGKIDEEERNEEGRNKEREIVEKSVERIENELDEEDERKDKKEGEEMIIIILRVKEGIIKRMIGWKEGIKDERIEIEMLIRVNMKVGIESKVSEIEKGNEEGNMEGKIVKIELSKEERKDLKGKKKIKSILKKDWERWKKKEKGDEEKNNVKKLR